MLYFFLGMVFLLIIGYVVFKPKKLPPVTLQLNEHAFLEKNVLFYKNLPKEKQAVFIEEVHEFLQKIKITPG